MSKEPAMSKPMDQKMRAKYGFLEAWVSIIGNTGLFAIKAAIGFSINSISLIADAFHTLSDVLTSVVVLIGFMITRIPADEHHPYGHGRVEPIATLIIAILLAVVGYEFGKESIARFFHPEKVQGTLLAIIVMFASAAGKEWMARFSFSLGKKINSQALYADGWHHRSDAIASALIPIALLGAIFKIYWLDTVFGLGVSVLILYTAFAIAYPTIDKLMGHIPDKEYLDKIEKSAKSVSGVKGVHDIAVHNYGDHNAISLHIEVDGNMNIARAHEIATKVEDTIVLNTNGTVTVHVEIKETTSNKLTS